MSLRRVNEVSGRLSLRPPQRTSLEILDHVFDTVPLGKSADPSASLDALRAEFPHVADFEREFPSLCFSLATGVGKTRLMGAFIAYLHLDRGLSDFFVLAPNLTIYKKLIDDFTPGNPKYVFRGVGEFASGGIEVITGDNYETGRGVREPARQQTYDFSAGRARLPEWQKRLGFENAGVHVNIFNISKINSEVRGGKSPRIKRLREYLGQSYFDYLSGLDDLVLLMDESHRYRGSAGIKVLNELRPILGLELTATPQTESGTKSFRFKNIIYDYPLATAMADGFVKEPAVATRENFRPADYDEDQLERIKLEDGIRLHENTKVELEVYARQFGRRIVKPFLLVVAQDTAHANAIVERIKGDDFFEGQYRDKVITVHSKQSGEEEDETIAQLLSVESPENPTEIVVHVNKLKEGWDVTNLYTIVPLRAASSKNLVEQSIGRGLRLPYGERTGVAAVDRLTIVAHDRFQAIVDEANNPNSIIRSTVVLGRDVGFERKQAKLVPSRVEDAISGTSASSSAEPSSRPLASFPGEEERKVAQATLQVLRGLERDARRIPRSASLQAPEIRAEIAAKVAVAVAPLQPLFASMSEPPDIAAIAARVVDMVVTGTIDLPKIIVSPTGDVTIGYHEFDLDVAGLNPQPVSQDILIQHLRTNSREMLTGSGHPIREERPEDYLVRGLIDFDDIDYEAHADLLYRLSAQVVDRLRSYLADEVDVHNVLQYHQQSLVNLIHARMQEHRWERAMGYEATVSQGFEVPRALALDEIRGAPIRNFRESVEKRSDIPKFLFGGFSRCLYPVQKFGSDPERRFAILLEDERDDLKWFKPARNQFKIFYRAGEGYEPDFVVETATAKYLCEPKRADETTDPIVLDKARAATAWCRHATDHELAHGGKPWSYLLIPHDAITASATLRGLAASYTFESAEDERVSPLVISRV